MVLVGNKTDQWGDRMVSKEEGHKRFREISCACFHEISVRESVDQVLTVFRDVFRFWRILSKYPKIKRSTSDLQSVCDLMSSPDSGCPNYDPSPPDMYEMKKQFFIIGRFLCISFTCTIFTDTKERNIARNVRGLFNREAVIYLY